MAAFIFRRGWMKFCVIEKSSLCAYCGMKPSIDVTSSKWPVRGLHRISIRSMLTRPVSSSLATANRDGSWNQDKKIETIYKHWTPYTLTLRIKCTSMVIYDKEARQHPIPVKKVSPSTNPKSPHLVVSISHFHGFQGEGTESVDQVMQGHIIQIPRSHQKHIL